MIKPNNRRIAVYLQLFRVPSNTNRVYEMACKNAESDYNYKLVDDESDLQDAISELKQKIEDQNALIAVDCEGVSLSRKGALTIITVATEDLVYIFDVLKLGRIIFSSGLGEILADKFREKLMFDCRQDSDALWHQFHVKLAGVLDLQLLEVIYRRESASAMTRRFSTRNRRSQRTGKVENIYGFRRCIELYVKDEKLVKIKDKGKDLIKEDEKVWKKRPLTDALIKYCVVDTMGMFKLFDKMKAVNGGERACLRVASEKYADMYRGKTRRSFDEFESNAFLPLDVIPDKGTLNFSPTSTKCSGCRRRFPQEEFSAAELRKGKQKCRVCKQVKRRADVKLRREAQWRHEFEEDDYCSYDSFNPLGDVLDDVYDESWRDALEEDYNDYDYEESISSRDVIDPDDWWWYYDD